MAEEIVEKELWDHYSELPNPAWYEYKNNKEMKRKTEMKNFLLNHKGNKYKANNILSLLWNFATGKISK
jgi:hypothetical protein